MALTEHHTIHRTPSHDPVTATSLKILKSKKGNLKPPSNPSAMQARGEGREGREEGREGRLVSAGLRLHGSD